MIKRLIIIVRLVIIVVNKQYKIEDISESNRSAGNKPVIVVSGDSSGEGPETKLISKLVVVHDGFMVLVVMIDDQ